MSGGNSFPPSFFLDSSIFIALRLDVPSGAQVSTPVYIKEIIGDMGSIRAIVSRYFESVHRWMAIISKKFFYIQHLNPMSQLPGDVSLLILCMKLITWLPTASGEDSKSIHYYAAKRFYSELEAMGIYSIQILQSGILIALYEFGHAIYPAAYLSIGACARYGSAFGFDSSNISCIPESGDWIQVEERKRSWWAIMILDRCVALGDAKRALAIQEPGMSSILPMNDTDWDEGIQTPNKQYTLGSASDLNMGKLARLVQAAHLLGRVLRNASDEIPDETFRRQEAVKLYRALSALLSLSEAESSITELEFCSQIAICNCALLVLFKTHKGLINDLPSQTEQKWDTKVAVAKRAAEVCKIFLTTEKYPVDRIAPLVAHFYYQSALLYFETYQSTWGGDSYETFELLKRGLSEIGKKWQCGGEMCESVQRSTIPGD
ncbi:hypothetical protein F5884DRAFT_659231 [Xylogone sp. PMI_703]|nr:hypothetical protein F5884DRAFT_659231 [Xylogone sp. PMI_703]